MSAHTPAPATAWDRAIAEMTAWSDSVMAAKARKDADVLLARLKAMRAANEPQVASSKQLFDYLGSARNARSCRLDYLIRARLLQLGEGKEGAGDFLYLAARYRALTFAAAVKDAELAARGLTRSDLARIDTSARTALAVTVSASLLADQSFHALANGEADAIEKGRAA